MTPDEEFIRSTIGMIAHVLNELTATVGAITVHAVSDQAARAELHEGLEDLHRLTKQIADAFPPPPMNGNPHR